MLLDDVEMDDNTSDQHADDRDLGRDMELDQRGIPNSTVNPKEIEGGVIGLAQSLNSLGMFYSSVVLFFMFDYEQKRTTRKVAKASYPMVCSLPSSLFLI
jgi:hypothetical protein